MEAWRAIPKGLHDGIIRIIPEVGSQHSKTKTSILRTHNSMRGLELTLALATRNASMTFESLAKQVPYFGERCCFGAWWTCTVQSVHTNPYCTLIISFVFEYVFLIDACAMAGRHWPAWAPRPCNAVLPQEAILRVRAWWESGCVPSKARCLSHSFFIVSSIFLNFRFNLSTCHLQKQTLRGAQLVLEWSDDIITWTERMTTMPDTSQAHEVNKP